LQLQRLQRIAADDGRPLDRKEETMAKYGKKAQAKVKRAMHERKEGTLRSGGSGKKVTSRKQAIAIGLSEARREGGKVPPRKKSATKSASKSSGRKSSTKTARKSATSKSPAKKSAKKSSGRKSAKKSAGKSSARKSAKKS
jgi:hypothetical protein